MRKLKIAVLSAETGQGHTSVMEALKEELECWENLEVDYYPSFYEDLMVSNRILSSFYNFLMVNSIELCGKYGEFTYLTKSDSTEEFYMGIYDNLKKLFDKEYLIIISVSHSINNAIIRYIKENDLDSMIYFAIVITDPYVPTAVGYNAIGADRYYCANSFVKKYLVNSKVDEEKIKVFGYPLRKKFFDLEFNRFEYPFKDKKVTIYINSGSKGVYHNLFYLKEIICRRDLNIFISCGENISLYTQCKRMVERYNCSQNVKVYQYCNNINEIIFLSDIIVTKPGANAVYEVLALKKHLLIDGVEGFLFQEKGIKDLISKYNIGKIMESYSDINVFIDEYIKNRYKYSYDIYVDPNASKNIISDIINCSNKKCKVHIE